MNRAILAARFRLTFTTGVLIVGCVCAEPALSGQKPTAAPQPEAILANGQAAPGTQRPQNLRTPSPLIRNRKDGTIEVVSNGIVFQAYPPGYFFVAVPNAEAIQRENMRTDALQEQEKTEAEQRQKLQQEETEAAEEAAKKKKIEDDEKKKQSEERAELAGNAVNIFNGMTGDYVQAVPLDVVVEKMNRQEKQLKGKEAEKKAQERAALEKKAVTIYDGMTGLYIQAVPVNALTDPSDSDRK